MSPLPVIVTVPVRLVLLIVRAFQPRANVAALAGGIALLGAHARLIIEMAREDLSSRYRGQLFGSAWILIHPLAMSLLYLFLFGVVFSQRVDRTTEMPLNYTAYMLAGLIPWLTFQAAMLNSVNSVAANAALVKQFIFPIEVLPIRDVASATVTWFVGVAATLVYIASVERTVTPMWLLLPVVLALQVLAMIGVAFVLSAVAVFFKDLKDFLTLFTLIALFLMPVVYVPGWVPAIFRPIIWINPFTYMTWVYQDVIYFGRFEHPLAWALFAAGAPLIFAWGTRLFGATKPMFANAL